MAASLTTAALLLLPWPQAWGVLDKSDLHLSEDTIVNGALGLNGTLGLNGALDVNGALGLNGTLGLNGALDVKGALGLNGSSGPPRCEWTLKSTIPVGKYKKLAEIFFVKTLAGEEKAWKKFKRVHRSSGKSNKEAKAAFWKEKEVMQDIADCSNIAMLDDTDFCVTGSGRVDFQFLMPVYTTDLSEYIKKYKGSHKGKCFEHIFFKVVEGVECMHDSGWIHNDITAENVLITHPEDPGNHGKFQCPEVEVAVVNYGLASRGWELQDQLIDSCKLLSLVQTMHSESKNYFVPPYYLVDLEVNEKCKAER